MQAPSDTITSDSITSDSLTMDASSSAIEASSANNRVLTNYYVMHSRIYDATRWSFLFGRKEIVKIAANHHQPERILEVGCGTGINLQTLNRYFPNSSLTGVDLSPAMLERARKNLARRKDKINLREGAYGTVPLDGTFDLVLFSYALTMFNPGWEEAIDQAYEDLNPGGIIAVVDFHDSALPPFKRWMGVNHVQMNGHLLPKLKKRFRQQHSLVKKAYGGIWEYCLFIGRKS